MLNLIDSIILIDFNKSFSMSAGEFVIFLYLFIGLLVKKKKVFVKFFGPSMHHSIWSLASVAMFTMSLCRLN